MDKKKLDELGAAITGMEMSDLPSEVSPEMVDDFKERMPDEIVDKKLQELEAENQPFDESDDDDASDSDDDLDFLDEDNSETDSEADDLDFLDDDDEGSDDLSLDLDMDTSLDDLSLDDTDNSNDDLGLSDGEEESASSSTPSDVLDNDFGLDDDDSEDKGDELTETESNDDSEETSGDSTADDLDDFSFDDDSSESDEDLELEQDEPEAVLPPEEPESPPTTEAPEELESDLEVEDPLSDDSGESSIPEEISKPDLSGLDDESRQIIGRLRPEKRSVFDDLLDDIAPLSETEEQEEHDDALPEESPEGESESSEEEDLSLDEDIQLEDDDGSEISLDDDAASLDEDEISEPESEEDELSLDSEEAPADLELGDDEPLSLDEEEDEGDSLELSEKEDEGLSLEDDDEDEAITLDDDEASDDLSLDDDDLEDDEELVLDDDDVDESSDDFSLEDDGDETGNLGEEDSSANEKGDPELDEDLDLDLEETAEATSEDDDLDFDLDDLGEETGDSLDDLGLDEEEGETPSAVDETDPSDPFANPPPVINLEGLSEREKIDALEGDPQSLNDNKLDEAVGELDASYQYVPDMPGMDVDSEDEAEDDEPDTEETDSDAEESDDEEEIDEEAAALSEFEEAETPDLSGEQIDDEDESPFSLESMGEPSLEDESEESDEANAADDDLSAFSEVDLSDGVLEDSEAESADGEGDLGDSFEGIDDALDAVIGDEEEEDVPNDYKLALTYLKTFSDTNKRIVYTALTRGEVPQAEVDTIVQALVQQQDEELIVRRLYDYFVSINELDPLDELLGEDLQYERAEAGKSLRKNFLPIFIFSSVAILLASLLVGASFFIYRLNRVSNLYNRGLAQIERRNYQEGESSFSQAWEITPSSKKANEYAEAYIDKKRYYDAEKKYQLVLDEVDSSDFNTHFNFAKLDILRRQYPDAASRLKMLAEKESGSRQRDVMETEGDLYLRWGYETRPMLAEADKVYQELIQKKDKPFYHAKRLQAAAMAGDYLGSRELYENIKMDYGNFVDVPAYTWLLHEYIQEYLERHTGPVESTLAQDDQLYLVKSIERELRHLAKKADNHLPYYFEGSRWHLIHRELERSEVFAREGIKKLEKKGSEALFRPASLYNQLGKVYYLRDDLIESIEQFRKAEDLDGTHPITQLWLGKLYLNELAEPERANDHLNKAILNWRDEFDSEYPELLHSLAYSYYDKGKSALGQENPSALSSRENFQNALNYWYELSELKGENLALQYALGNTYLYLNEYDLAQAQIREAIKEAHPSYDDFVKNQGSVRADVKKRVSILSDLYNNKALAHMGKGFEGRRPVYNKKNALGDVIQSIEIKDKLGLMRGVSSYNFNRMNDATEKDFNQFKVADEFLDSRYLEGTPLSPVLE